MKEKKILFFFLVNNYVHLQFSVSNWFIHIFSLEPNAAIKSMPRTTFNSLLEALYRNDTRRFREILDNQGLPRVDKYYDYELLMRALRMNRKRIVNLLLNKKCRVIKPDRLSPEGTTTPLHLVAEKLGWCGVIEKMLQLGAHVNVVNADGNTPLHLAFIRQRSNRAVYLLLKNYVKDSQQDIRNNDGLGFMHIACMRSDKDSVREFFDKGMSDIYSQVMFCFQFSNIIDSCRQSNNVFFLIFLTTE